MMSSISRCLLFGACLLTLATSLSTVALAASVAPPASCDLTKGGWVPDASGRGYDSTCPYILPQMNCDKNGRKSSGYRRLRWQPSGCSIPKFNPTEFLTLATNKVMTYVGDVQNGQGFLSMPGFGQSLRCQLSAVSPAPDFTGLFGGVAVSGFIVPAYNFTFVYVFSPFMVKAGDLQAANAYSDKWNVFLDTMDPSLEALLPTTDYLVLNTGLWYNAAAGLRAFFYNGKDITVSTTPIAAHAAAISTITRFISSPSNVPSGFAGFLLTFPTNHYNDVFATAGTSCASFVTPLTSLLTNIASVRSQAVHWALAERQTVSRSAISVVDLVSLSLSRPDAHVGKFSGNPTYVDCTNWCVPGIPDAWTDVFYAKLLQAKSASGASA